MKKWCTLSRVLRAFFTVLLSLLGPIVWMQLKPSLVNEEPIKLLAQGINDHQSLNITPDVIRPELVERNSSPLFASHTVQARYDFPVAEGGRYTLYGTSSRLESQTVKTLVNGRIVDSWAFFPETGFDGSEPATHIIAPNVELHGGSNRLELDGEFLDERTFLLYFYRQRPLSPMKYAFIAALVFASLLMRHVMVDRVSLLPAAKLCAIVSTVLVVPVFASVLLYPRWGSEISHWGIGDRPFANRQRDFDDYLASDEFQQTRKSSFTVCVMGDSTHIWPPTESMLNLINKEFHDVPEDDILAYGLATGGLSAYDYYFLMNRVVQERPDLVVIPVNLQTFGNIWLYEMLFETPRRLERYLTPSQFYVGLTMQAGRRKASLAPILLDKVDMLFFHSRGLDFVNGLRSKFEDHYWPRAKPSRANAPEVPWLLWNENITNDHDLFEAFKNINRLARSHQIPILYYSVQFNIDGQKITEQDPRLQENYEFILNRIADSEYIYTAHLAEQNPSRIFVDEGEHLNRIGRAEVAGAIAKRIRLIKELRQ